MIFLTQGFIQFSSTNPKGAKAILLWDLHGMHSDAYVMFFYFYLQ